MSLERLTWKNKGYFTNEKGERVEPTPLGTPQAVIVVSSLDSIRQGNVPNIEKEINIYFENMLKLDEILSEANAYCRGGSINVISMSHCSEIFQLYKI